MEASIRKLRVNPAQVRTRIRMAGLAELALSMRNPDPALGLILKETADGFFEVVSGHRRWLAGMIAALAPIGTLDAMTKEIQFYCNPSEKGWIELTPALYEKLVNVVGELNLPATVWTGTGQDEVLLLLRANIGSEEPDLIGMAGAFHAAVERGIPLDDLAMTCGLSWAKADAILAIPMLPPIMQQMINDGELALEIVPRLTELEPRVLVTLGGALQQFLDRKVHVDNYTDRVLLAVAELQYKPKLPRRSQCSPESYNRMWLNAKAWEIANTETPEEVAHLMASRALEGKRVSGNFGAEPLLAELPSTQSLYSTPDYYGNVRLLPSAMDILEDLSCDTCAFAQLPEERLTKPLELPCREAGEFPAQRKCISWVPIGKRFSLRTPWSWKDGGHTVQSFEELLTHWESQRQYEVEHGTLAGPSSQVDQSGIEKQRRLIRLYMERHTEPPFDVEHPWATPCSQCAYLLEKSPVKSAPDAPHCWWAKGRRTLRFQAFWPMEANKWVSKPEGSIIPSCLQYAPSGPWSDFISESKTPAPYPRDVMVTLIRALARDANQDCFSTHSRGSLQFLTGRPEKSTSSHRGTFNAIFQQEEGALSLGQMCMVLQWMLLEWQWRHAHLTTALIPTTGGVVQFHRMDFHGALGLLDEAEVEED